MSANESRKQNNETVVASENRLTYGQAMKIDFVSTHIRENFVKFPGQMQVAARFLLDNPQEVALLSMREQARRAGVPAATMTRLAKQLGFAGFEELREIFVGAVRNSIEPFSSRAEHLVQQRENTDEDILPQMVERLSGNVGQLMDPAQRLALHSAAKTLMQARTVFSAGQRTAYSAAYHFAYLYGYFSTKTILVDGPGGIGADPMAQCGPEDALLVISLEPAAKRSVEIAHFARKRGTKIIAITGSPLSPVGRVADTTIIINHDSPTFFDAMTSAFAAVETLVAIVASAEGGKVPGAVRLREEQRRDLGEWWEDVPRGGKSGPKKRNDRSKTDTA
ncbi:MurR/RpiR family transcriptional regulator [Sinorhizobium meliloti]|uniref:MurR/RpiR family transcriptional regulator n=1 Tax=Rhizobium meliloti TaxID=382 RepID=UPI003D64A283